MFCSCNLELLKKQVSCVIKLFEIHRLINRKSLVLRSKRRVLDSSGFSFVMRDEYHRTISRKSFKGGHRICEGGLDIVKNIKLH